jgi:hypothetical protein
MSSPAISDRIFTPETRSKDAFEITISDLQAVWRRSAGKEKTSGRTRIASAMGASQTGFRLLLALIIGCGAAANLGGRVGQFAEREGALAPVSARGL